MNHERWTDLLSQTTSRYALRMWYETLSLVGGVEASRRASVSLSVSGFLALYALYIILSQT